MKNKKKSTGAANSDAQRQLSQFLSSFHSKRNGARAQCLNCDVWTTAGNSIPTAMHDKSINTIYIFRICADCYRSFINVPDDLKKDFRDNLKIKAKRAEAKQ